MKGGPMSDVLIKLNSGSLDPATRASVRRQVIETLKDPRADTLRQDVRQLLEEATDNRFRTELLEIIGSAQDQLLEDAVKKVINTAGSVEVLQTALTTLGKVKATGSFEILVGFLNHENPNVRLGSIYGLTALGDKRAVRYLLQRLDDQQSARCWWPSPKAGGYIIGREASEAVDVIVGTKLYGDKGKIERWIAVHA
jgi:hypothetical protein